jgi:hypothetical protein
MRVALLNDDHEHTAWVELPDNVRAPQTIVHDGTPYVRLTENCYVLTDGVFHSHTCMPLIQIARRFHKPAFVEAASTRWFSGCVGEARLKLDVKIASPWMQSMKLVIEDARAIRVQGVWSPDVDDLSASDESRRTNRNLLNRWRATTNKFCNEFRPPGSRLILTMLAIDLSGRIVCEIHKMIPATSGGKVPAQELSLRKHLLEGGLFSPAVWRMP